MDATELVSRDIQNYTKEFNSYNDLLEDPIYNMAQHAVRVADAQVKDSLDIILSQNEIEKMEKQIHAHALKRQFMDWTGRCSDYSIDRSQCLLVRTMKFPPMEQLSLVKTFTKYKMQAAMLDLFSYDKDPIQRFYSCLIISLAGQNSRSPVSNGKSKPSPPSRITPQGLQQVTL